jgi:hypothetical protein
MRMRNRVRNWICRSRSYRNLDGEKHGAAAAISNPVEVRDQNVDLGVADTAPDRSARSEQSSAALSRAISPRWRLRYRPKLAISLSTAAALVLIGLVVVWVAPGLIDSSERRMLHRTAVHRDDSVVRTGVTANFKTPITLYYREVDGSLRLLLTDEGEINRFVNENLLLLDGEREKIKADTLGRIETLLAESFGDRQASISRYADWYFEWGRSWAVLKEASVGGLRAIGPNNVQGIFEASRNEVESYLIRNYQRFVLRPELRNPVIEAGISQILAEAHLRYLAVLTTIDDRVQDFLHRHTRHLETLDPLAKLDVSLGWDAQQWKAPRYAVDDEAFRAAFKGTGVATVSALVAGGVRPAIERTIGPVFANVAVRVVGAMRPQIVGVAAGSLIEPGLGSLAGWAIGVGSGVAIDYVWDKNRERLDRPAFEAANAEALDATIQEWSRAIQRDLFRAIDVWFDDTRSVVVEHKISRKPPTG